MTGLIFVLAILGGTFCVTIAVSAVVALAFFWRVRRDATTANGRARQQELLALLFEKYARRELEREDLRQAEFWAREADKARQRSRREAGEPFTPEFIGPENGDRKVH